MPWPYIKFSQVILTGNVWRPAWRICMLILGLKALRCYNGLILTTSWQVRSKVNYNLVYTWPKWSCSIFSSTSANWESARDSVACSSALPVKKKKKKKERKYIRISLYVVCCLRK